MAVQKQPHKQTQQHTQPQTPPSLFAVFAYYRIPLIAFGLAVIIGSISFAITRSLIPAPVNGGASQESNAGATKPRGMNISADTMALIQRMQDTITQSPERHDVELRLANLFYDMGAFPMASATYAQYLKADPNNVSARIDYAYTLLRMNKSDEAIAETKVALTREPNHPIATFNLGVIYYQLGDMAQAKQWLEKAKTLAPNSRISEGADKILLSIK
jgi:tetratricopeptide (TPR) repeat protein